MLSLKILMVILGLWILSIEIEIKEYVGKYLKLNGKYQKIKIKS